MNLLVWTCQTISIVFFVTGQPNHSEFDKTPNHDKAVTKSHEHHNSKEQRYNEWKRKREEEMVYLNKNVRDKENSKGQINHDERDIHHGHSFLNKKEHNLPHTTTTGRESLIGDSFQEVFANDEEKKKYFEKMVHKFDKKYESVKPDHKFTITRHHHTKRKGTTGDFDEIYTASSGILHEMAKLGTHYTGDSSYYDREYYEEVKRDKYTPDDRSVSSDYESWERWYNDMVSKGENYTTPHYEWWTYDPTKSFETFEGKPLDLDRALYSLKMSSILPENVSAEVDKDMNDPKRGIIDFEFAKARELSREAWAKDVHHTNFDTGPVAGRRELRENNEILLNKFYDAEITMADNLEKDVKKLIVKPFKKGLYHFKKWMNPKYFTTTKKKELTWPMSSMDTQEMIGHYKNYLKVEKNITLPDDAGKSIFEKYTFTADSNYYDEDTGDLPRMLSESEC